MLVILVDSGVVLELNPYPIIPAVETLQQSLGCQGVILSGTLTERRDIISTYLLLGSTLLLLLHRTLYLHNLQQVSASSQIVRKEQ